MDVWPGRSSIPREHEVSRGAPRRARHRPMRLRLRPIHARPCPNTLSGRHAHRAASG
jgi:hypothetical protein